jgi:hypothetical protein
MAKVTDFEGLKKAVEGTKFAQDMAHNTNVNGKPMPWGYWNLILSIRDCGLYSKGIKPHRNWKISDVKWYFGISGSAEKMAETLKQYRDILMPPKVEEVKV